MELLGTENNHGIITKTYYENGHIFNERIQDVEDILKANKNDRNEALSYSEGTPNLYASIPTVVVHEWIKQGIIPTDYTAKDLLKVLRHPDYKNFKTRDTNE